MSAFVPMTTPGGATAAMAGTTDMAAISTAADTFSIGFILGSMSFALTARFSWRGHRRGIASTPVICNCFLSHLCRRRESIPAKT
jgi:hypothetical protein